MKVMRRCGKCSLVFRSPLPLLWQTDCYTVQNTSWKAEIHIYIYIFFWIYIYNIYIYLYTIQGYKAAKVDSDKLMMRDNKFMGYYTQLRPSNSSGESCRCGSHHARPVRVEPQSYPITRGPTASPLRSLANIAKLANIAINIPTICRCTLPKTNIKKEYK